MLFLRARQSIVVSAGLSIAAMLMYPGGTALDRSTRRYSMSQNFLSDLGMTVAYDGQPNTVGAALFIASLCILVLGVLGALTGFVRRYRASKAGQRFAYAAGVVGLLAGVAFVGVAFTPENEVMALHLRFTLLGFRLLPVAAFFLTLAARATRGTSTAISASEIGLWMLLTLSLAAYAILLDLSPALDARSVLMVYVVAQKVIALVLMLVLAYQSITAERVAPSA